MNKEVTNYEKLVSVVNDASKELYIVEKGTGREGVATIPTKSKNKNTVYVFYGADDGSDDKEIAIDDFNNNFDTKVIEAV